jgi:hypothetical protein
MFAPVYENTPINTLEQRRAALSGWIDSPFVIADLLNNIIDNPNVALQIYDGTSLKPENLLFSSSNVLLTRSSQFSLQKQVVFNDSTGC